MIGGLRGRIFRNSPGRVWLETGGGVIYRVEVLVTLYPECHEGQELLLHTVSRQRDEELHLYGFADPVERDLFELLISVSGVGARMALSILSSLAVQELPEVINSGDLRRLSKVPGVGKKTAQRLVLELTGKLTLGDGAGMSRDAAVGEEVLSALVNLGYSRKVAEDALALARKEEGDLKDFELLFRRVMKRLNR